jgi:hypothetical protein
MSLFNLLRIFITLSPLPVSLLVLAFSIFSTSNPEDLPAQTVAACQLARIRDFT